MHTFEVPATKTLNSSHSGLAVPASRLAFLDVARGMAALAVVIEHGSERFFPAYLRLANTYFTFGVFGVATFFLVSGFIIPVSIERHNSLADFWKARFFRLYPMYWFSICLALVAFHGPAHWSWLVVLANATMLQTFIGVPNISGVYWTLSVELVFYFICSLLCFLGKLGLSLFWLYVAAASNLVATLIFGLVFHRSLQAGVIALLMSAFFGTLLYRHYHGSVSLQVILRALPLLALSMVTGFWFRFHLLPRAHDLQAFGFLGVAMSYLGAYVLFITLYWQRERRFSAPLIWLGRVSYSLYLIHGYALGLVPVGSYPVFRLVLVIVIAVAFSGVTFLLIEKPGIALYRRLSQPKSTQLDFAKAKSSPSSDPLTGIPEKAHNA